MGKVIVRPVPVVPLFLVVVGIASAGGPENVMIIANRDSEPSRALAEYYLQRRQVPAKNICWIRAEPVETVSRETYDERIEKPVRLCLALGAAAGRSFHYAVAMMGVPLRVSGTSGLQATASSVDSELATLPARMAGIRTAIAGRLGNPYFRAVDMVYDPAVYQLLLVTRLAAYDAATARLMVDRCLEAERKMEHAAWRDAGRFVLDLRSGDPADEGDRFLDDASLLLPPKRTVIDSSSEVLYGQTNVIGYASWGSNDLARKQRFSRFQFRPGAVVSEFVSTSARTLVRPMANWTIGRWSDKERFFAGSPQSLSADYLEEGASAVTGNVYEPFLQYCPRPEILLPAYARGRNLAESYYASLPALSWMNVMLGDPLCRIHPEPALRKTAPARRKGDGSR